jgi:hypothetical protein
MRALSAHRPEEKAGKPTVPAGADDQHLGIRSNLDEDFGRLAVLDGRLHLDPSRVDSVRRCLCNLLGDFLERLLNRLVERRSEANAAVDGGRYVPYGHELEAGAAKLGLSIVQLSARSACSEPSTPATIVLFPVAFTTTPFHDRWRRSNGSCHLRASRCSPPGERRPRRLERSSLSHLAPECSDSRSPLSLPRP